jgi:hypothetical protein
MCAFFVASRRVESVCTKAGFITAEFFFVHTHPSGLIPINRPRAGAWNNLESGPRRELIPHSSALIPIIRGARFAHRIVGILLMCYGASREPRTGAWNNLESGNLESGNLESGPRRELIPHSSALIPINRPREGGGIIWNLGIWTDT